MHEVFSGECTSNMNILSVFSRIFHFVFLVGKVESFQKSDFLIISEFVYIQFLAVTLTSFNKVELFPR